MNYFKKNTLCNLSTRYLLSLTSLFILVSLLISCAVNPVTGRKEFAILSQSAEIEMGTKNYLPAQQSQGGQYVLSPEISEYVSRIGTNLARVSDRPELPYQFVVLNNSVPNAWAMPGGKISINRGLLTELESEGELAAVLAHEIVHAAARHGAKAVERGMLLQAGTLGIGMAVSGNQYSDLLVGAAAVGANLINLKYTRSQELEADYYSMHYLARAGYDPYVAVTLQDTFIKLNNQGDPNWITGLFASHPPSIERLEANRKTASLLPQGGFTGKNEYIAMIGPLTRKKKAYEEYDNGVKALVNNNPQEAFDLANNAIEMEPFEAHFFGLLGDIYFKEGQFRKALGEYDKATRLNNNYYRFFLQRGLTEQKLGLFSQARENLARSNDLMPTAAAHYGMGELALQGGDQKTAINHFKTAASSESSLGRQAYQQLAVLELPINPEKYLEVNAAVDTDGTLFIRVKNRSPVHVGQVAVAVSLIAGGGQVAGRDDVFISGRIESGGYSDARTGFRLNEAQRRQLSVSTRITSARLAE